jgi:hypothetical protein
MLITSVPIARRARVMFAFSFGVFEKTAGITTQDYYPARSSCRATDTRAAKNLMRDLGSESGSINARHAEYAEGMGCWPTVESIASGWIPKITNQPLYQLS